LKSGVIRFSASVDPDLLEEFDETIGKLGYSRSNAVQTAIRDFLTEHKWTAEPEANVAGAITMIYEHDVKASMGALTHIQHQHGDVITSTTHVHLDEHNCLEMIAVHGSVKSIQRLANELMTSKGIKQLKIVTFMI
jgi:CopG family nickel-responsive transcriptional regulator